MVKMNSPEYAMIFPEVIEKKIANRGGKIAGNARKELEEELRHSVITSQNANQLNHVVGAMIERSTSMVK